MLKQHFRLFLMNFLQYKRRVSSWQNVKKCFANFFVHNTNRAHSCKPFKEPRNGFPAWRAVTAALFVVPARRATQAGGIESLESIPGLLKHLQIWTQVAWLNFRQRRHRIHLAVERSANPFCYRSYVKL